MSDPKIKSKAEKTATLYAGLGSYFSNTVKDVDIERRIVEGVYNSYYFLDSDRDILIKGAASQSIKSNGPKSKKVGNKIKNLLNHDWRRNTAKINELEEDTVNILNKDAFGIRYVAEYPNSEAALLEKIQMGIYDAHSVGFRYKEVEFANRNGSDDEVRLYNEFVSQITNYNDEPWFWVVKRIELFEGSVVWRGVNEQTPFLSVKGTIDTDKVNKMFTKMASYRDYIKNGRVGTDEDFIIAEMEYMKLTEQMKQLFSMSSNKDNYLSEKQKQRIISDYKNDQELKNKVGQNQVSIELGLIF